MCKSKYNIKVLSQDNFSKRCCKQRANSHEIVSLTTHTQLRYRFDFLKLSLPMTNYETPLEIIRNM